MFNSTYLAHFLILNGDVSTQKYSSFFVKKKKKYYVISKGKRGDLNVASPLPLFAGWRFQVKREYLCWASMGHAHSLTASLCASPRTWSSKPAPVQRRFDSPAFWSSSNFKRVVELETWRKDAAPRNCTDPWIKQSSVETQANKVKKFICLCMRLWTLSAFSWYTWLQFDVCLKDVTFTLMQFSLTPSSRLEIRLLCR